MINEHLHKRAFAASSQAGNHLDHRLADKWFNFIKISCSLNHYDASAKDWVIKEHYVLYTKSYVYTRNFM
jgi:hypothetical protein